MSKLEQPDADFSRSQSPLVESVPNDIRQRIIANEVVRPRQEPLTEEDSMFAVERISEHLEKYRSGNLGSAADAYFVWQLYFGDPGNRPGEACESQRAQLEGLVVEAESRKVEVAVGDLLSVDWYTREQARVYIERSPFEIEELLSADDRLFVEAVVEVRQTARKSSCYSPEVSEDTVREKAYAALERTATRPRFDIRFTPENAWVLEYALMARDWKLNARFLPSQARRDQGESFSSFGQTQKSKQQGVPATA